MAEATSGDMTDPAYLAARAQSVELAGPQGLDRVLDTYDLDVPRLAGLLGGVFGGGRRRLREHLGAGGGRGGRAARLRVDVRALPR